MQTQILHNKKRRRVEEPETPLSPFAQNEAPVLNPVSFVMKTGHDKGAADVPLPEEPAEINGDHPQGWITEEAFLTDSPGARQVRQREEVKMSQSTPAQRRLFLKSMGTEWQTLLKNQASKALSLEETARAREHRGAAAPPSLIEKPVPPDLNTSPLHLPVPPV